MLMTTLVIATGCQNDKPRLADGELQEAANEELEEATDKDEAADKVLEVDDLDEVDGKDEADDKDEGPDLG